MTDEFLTENDTIGAAHELVVEDLSYTDNFVFEISKTTMERLDFHRGDMILIKGKEGRMTVLACVVGDGMQDSKVRLNQYAWRNLGVSIGDVVTLQVCTDIQYAELVQVSPIGDTVSDVHGELYYNYLAPYMLKAQYRPLAQSDLFMVEVKGKRVEFKVIAMDPAPYGILGPQTFLQLMDVYTTREDADRDVKDLKNRAIVEEYTHEDSSVFLLNSTTAEKFGLFRRDVAEVHGRGCRRTVLVCLTSDDMADSKVRDAVLLTRSVDIKYGKRIHVLPIKDTINGFAGDLFQTFLKPYFLEAYRPLMEGDLFNVKEGGRNVEFKVIATDPSPYCIVAQDTKIHTEGTAIERERALDDIEHTPVETTPPKSELQGFRAIYTQDPTPPLSPSSPVYIATRYDPNLKRNIILWSDVLRIFEKAQYVLHDQVSLSFIADDNFQDIIPLRIEAKTDVVLDVVMNGTNPDSVKYAAQPETQPPSSSTKDIAPPKKSSKSSIFGLFKKKK
ncbi:AAA ATPase cdc48 [Linnemannia elongata]|nr:AAA ATPase cdc48 [Linnemannia elongata]